MKPPNAPPRSSIRLAQKLKFCAVEVAEYLFRSDVVPYWLGKDALLIPKLGTDVKLSQAVVRVSGFQSPLSGIVTSLNWPAPDGEIFELVITLDSVPTDQDHHVIFRLTPLPEQACRIRIEHGGLIGTNEVHSSVKHWQSVLNKISRLVAKADRLRRRDRQAVIVVHGIGEQRPGQMLRQFITNVFAGEKYSIKPDYVSQMSGMQKATVPSNESTRPKTDVYEFYWAHLIRDTTVAQVCGWIFRLMSARRKNIPESLISLVWGLRATGIAAIMVTSWLMTKNMSGWLIGLGLSPLVVLPALTATTLKVFRDQFIVGYVGDAARYLEPRPENIARRQEICKSGAALLDALHDNGRYSRIIVYGHSLGSVIAYDILSFTWIRRSRRRAAQSQTSSRELRALEDLLNPRCGKITPAVRSEDVQFMQHAAWLEYQRNGFEWLVSDLVTAGSPLTHARWLLNLDEKTEFQELVGERSLPTCPPQTETIKSPVKNVNRQVFTFTHAYNDEKNPKRKRSVQVPHHAGLFALTRWTNIYFKCSGLTNGDPIAGPLAEHFGSWIRDVQLKDRRGFAHNWYTNSDIDQQAVSQVRDALNLPFQRPLVDYAPPALLQETE